MTPPRPGTGLELRDLSVPFGSRTGIDALSMHVAPGERVALLGPSGVGKTTLLRAVAGLERITGGSVHVNGRDVTGLQPEARGTVYLHQTPSMFPHLSVIDNVGFPLEVRGMPRAQARQQAAALLDRVHMASFANRASTSLSGGQRHRVALARALAASPAAMLFDEPFSALDPALRADVRGAVLELLQRDDAPSTIIVTHDVDEAAALGQRIVVLLDGAIAQTATPAELLARPSSLRVARFLGVPNVVHGECDGRGIFTCPVGRFPCALARGPAALVSRADGMRTTLTTGAPHGVITVVNARIGGISIEVGIGDIRVTVTPAPGVPMSVGEHVGIEVITERVHIVSRPDDSRDV